MIGALLLPLKDKERLLEIWREMNDEDKQHFINQMALALTVWGSDKQGKRLAIDVIRFLIEDGSNTLSDFGLYVSGLEKLKKIPKTKSNRIRRAEAILDGYRIKNGLSSMPHKPII